MKKMGKQDIVDGWSPDGLTFITGGIGYRVGNNLSQLCIGPVDHNGEPLKPPEKHQDEKDGVPSPQQVIVHGSGGCVTENECEILNNENNGLKNTLKTLSDAPQSNSDGLEDVMTHNLSPKNGKQGILL